MASYRFCRPDDIPRLVAAVARCFEVHFPGTEPLTVEGFREEMRRLDVWPSNSLIAAEGDEPVAVLIGTKRAREVLVRRIGVRPGHERRGHGLHLLDSLSHKLAVLGPERLVVELPERLAPVRPFFAAAGYVHEAVLTDWRLDPASPPPPAPPEGLVADGSFADLERSGVEPAAAEASWHRQPESLRASDDVRAAALLGPERVEAWLAYRAVAGGAEILALGCADARLRVAAWRHLLGHLLAELPGEVLMRAVHGSEAPPEVLEGFGFVAGERTERLVATAVPA